MGKSLGKLFNVELTDNNDDSGSEDSLRVEQTRVQNKLDRMQRLICHLEGEYERSKRLDVVRRYFALQSLASYACSQSESILRQSERPPQLRRTSSTLARVHSVLSRTRSATTTTSLGSPSVTPSRRRGSEQVLGGEAVEERLRITASIRENRQKLRTLRGEFHEMRQRHETIKREKDPTRKYGEWKTLLKDVIEAKTVFEPPPPAALSSRLWKYCDNVIDDYLK